MIVFFLQISALLLVSLITMLLAKRHPAMRLAIARVSLVAIVLLAFASPRLQEREKPVVPVTLAVSSLPVPRATAPVRPVVMTESAAIAPAFELEPEQVVAGVWLLGSAVLGFGLLLGYYQLARIRKECSPCEDPLVAEIAKANRIAVPRLREGDSVGNPFVAGVLRPTIFLPRGWLSQNELATRRAVLEHEVAHIANGDLRWGLFHRLLCILLWPQPLLWALKRTMASAEEELCDRHVLAAGVVDYVYADCLLRLREGLKARPCPALGIGAVSPRSSLSKRVEAILDRRRSRAVRLSLTAKVLTRVGGFGIALLAAVLIARPAPGLGRSSGDYVDHPYETRVALYADGKPVLGAEAWLMKQEYPEVAPQRLRVEGNEVFVEKVIDTSFIPRATLVVKAKGRGFGYVSLWPASKQVTRLDLPEKYPLTGHVLLPNGKPASHLLVRLRMMTSVQGDISDFVLTDLSRYGFREFSTTSDANGQFRFPDVSRENGVEIDVEDDRYARCYYTTRPSDLVIGKPVILQLRPAGKIVGTFTQNGVPVKNLPLRVIACQEGTNAFPFSRPGAFSDSQGNYEIKRVPAGKYLVSPSIDEPICKEFAAEPASHIVLAEGQTQRVNIRVIAGGVIQGRLYNVNGEPVPNSYISVETLEHMKLGLGEIRRTDSQGRFRFRGVPGKLRLVGHTSPDEMSVEDVIVHEGETKEVDLHEHLLHPRKIEPQAEQTFRLASGAKIEIGKIGEVDPKKPGDWLKEGLDKVSPDLSVLLGYPEAPKGQRRLLLKLVTRNVPGDGVSYSVQYGVNDISMGFDLPLNKQGESLNFSLGYVLENAKSVDVHVSVASAAWKSLAITQIGQGEFKPEAEVNKRNSNLGPLAVVRFAIPLQFRGQDLTARLYTRSGKVLAPFSTEIPAVNPGLKKAEFQFEKALPKDIAKVKLLSRPFEKVVFRNVAIPPK